MTRTPRPPPVTHCPNCHRAFPTIWAYKAHQDECIAASRRQRGAPPTDRGELGDPPTDDEQVYLDEQDEDNPRDPESERDENRRMFRAEVAVPLRGNREGSP